MSYRTAIHTLYLFFPVLLLMLLSCASDSSRESVVARVNGEPIYLEDVKAGHDAQYFRWQQNFPQSLQEIESSYAEILLNLVVHALVSQEMQARGMNIDENEVARKEQKVRMDYPEDEFEKMLIEEYIDLNFWRKQVRQKLIRDKFTREFLAPEVRVDVDEIEQYYWKNIEEFYVPDRIVFAYLSSIEEKNLEEALIFLEKNQDLAKVTDKNFKVCISSYEMRADQLPYSLAGDLKLLQPGELSRVKNDKATNSFYSLYLLERKEGKLLKPHRVYEIIEDRLREEKVEKAFDLWLEETVAASRIEINHNLLKIITNY